MNAWCDSSAIDAFLPRVAQEILTLVAGNLSVAATTDVALGS